MPPRNASYTCTRPFSMYPTLHESVTSLLDPFDLSMAFHKRDAYKTCIKASDISIPGKFICTDPGCTKGGWGSKRIAMTIRLYPESKYNARIYHQRCEMCEGAVRPLVDEMIYAERVAYWIKKWNGVSVEENRRKQKSSRRPHDQERCEGCLAGHCRG
ncbi:3CxxC-type zinc finger protein [Aspergillus undulatus]|uniref:3CxxC-type zinc finger protein n=1 Tax=Aspergillus undulatus TaxID=1810928 RepID=UPI003CCD4D75